jgi:2-C-methyl-D-erythritol 4-phosphate cytidylyltransferase
MILEYTLDSFENAEAVDRIVIVMAPAWREKLEEELRGKYRKLFGFADPGSIRQESILSGLELCMADSQSEQDKVIIHDGVRPLLSPSLVLDLFSKAETAAAVIPVTPCIDTMKVLQKKVWDDGSETLSAVPGAVADRSMLYGAQTPQVFHSEVLKQAYEQAFDTAFTDDASVVEKYGKNLSYLIGERFNIKITTRDDLIIAGAVMSMLGKN